MREQFRRYQDNLKILGSAVIMFGCWSLVKVLLWLILSWKSDFSQLSTINGLDVILFAFFIILFAIIIIALLLRLYIGMSARKDAAGKPKKPVYIVLAIIIAAIDAYGLISYLGTTLLAGNFLTLTDIISTIVDITSFIVILEMIIIAFKFRRLRKQLESEAAHE